MKFTRRGFIRNSFLLGSSLIFHSSSFALPKKEEPWIPTYEKLEREDKFEQRVNQAYALFENCHHCPYERLEILKILDGVIDIYMPDMKYMDPDQAAKYSAGASDYPELTKKAILEMNRQVGVFQTDKQGIALRGVIIRHLVMPNRVAGTEKFAKWVAQVLPKSTYVNIMPQYRVEYKAYEHPEIARGITVQEFLEAMEWAEKNGLSNLDPNSVAVRNFYKHRRSE